MELDNQQKTKIKNFVAACNDFLGSKFILSDIKISKMLKTIADSEQIYNLLAECMINFNFEEELNRSFFKGTNGAGSFILPVEYYKLIPLVFNLLVSLDSKKIEFKDFLNRHFNFNNQNEQYMAFGHTVVVPFRDAIIELFSMDMNDPSPEEATASKKPKLYEKEEPTDTIADLKPFTVEGPEKKAAEDSTFKAFFEEVKTHTNYIADKLVLVKKESRRENIKLIVNAIMRTCDFEDITILSALVSALNEIAAKEKYLKYGINKICECYYEFILHSMQE
ncbi:MAG: hypothetical protein LBN07_03410 [Christensenellaceae bacterium]|jgi:hypothetical protein|nr:hypothetical protein [Christensenellaceae bacterium]